MTRKVSIFSVSVIVATGSILVGPAASQRGKPGGGGGKPGTVTYKWQSGPRKQVTVPLSHRSGRYRSESLRPVGLDGPFKKEIVDGQFCKIRNVPAVENLLTLEGWLPSGYLDLIDKPPVLKRGVSGEYHFEVGPTFTLRKGVRFV